jgi:hypothetical protein
MRSFRKWIRNIKSVETNYLLFFTELCKFPVNWSGQWFQSGVPHLLTINTSVIETKGVCVENDGDKFIIEDR